LIPHLIDRKNLGLIHFIVVIVTAIARGSCTSLSNFHKITMSLKSIVGNRRLASLLLQRNRLLIVGRTQRRDVRMLGPKGVFRFNYKIWWEENGDIVRQLLDSSINCELFNDVANTSSSSILLKRRFEQVYSSDAIYQDLFIDTPPSRDVLKYSFELISRYWEIEVTELGPPVLMIVAENNKVGFQTSYGDFPYGSRCTEAPTKKTSSISDEIFIRVPYSVTQRPRLFVSYFAILSEKFPPSSVLRRLFFEYEYEGWIDLYLRPKKRLHSDLTNESTATHSSGSSSINNNKNNHLEVYRHDDRIRVFPPHFVCRYIKVNNNNNNNEKGDNFIDMLTIISKIPLVSTIFKWFRRVHGRIVEYFSNRTISPS